MISLMKRLLLPLLALFLATHTATAAGTTEDGLAFLQANRDKVGVVTLPSGLQYKVINQGKGVYHPAKNTACSCHYAGTLIDGTPFDSSYERGSPTTFAPNQVIPGWTEAMQLMVEGDKWELYIPSELGYGDRGSPPTIPGGAVLVFQMEIMEILGDDKVLAIQCNVTSTELCNDKENAYISKTKEWDDGKVATEAKRLGGLAADGKLKPELAEWIQRRLHILRQKATPLRDEEEL